MLEMILNFNIECLARLPMLISFILVPFPGLPFISLPFSLLSSYVLSCPPLTLHHYLTLLPIHTGLDTVSTIDMYSSLWLHRRITKESSLNSPQML